MSSPADRWQKLYQKVDRDLAERDAVSSRRQGEIERSAAFEAWCQAAATEAMRLIHAQVRERATQFMGETGNVITVSFPAQAPNAQVARAAPEMIFLKLALDRVSQYLYSARAPAKLPALHLMSTVEQLRPAAAATPKRAKASYPPGERIVSRPLGRIVQRADGGFEIRERAANQEGDAGALVEIDAIVFKAFESLVTNWQRSNR